MLTRLVVIILQNIQIPNQCCIPEANLMLFVNYTSKKDIKTHEKKRVGGKGGSGGRERAHACWKAPAERLTQSRQRTEVTSLPLMLPPCRRHPHATFPRSLTPASACPLGSQDTLPTDTPAFLSVPATSPNSCWPFTIPGKTPVMKESAHTLQHALSTRFTR